MVARPPHPQAAIYRARWRARNLAAGLCAHCGRNPVDPAHVHCAVCRAVRAEAQRARPRPSTPNRHAIAKLRHAAGMCACGADRDTDSPRCAACRRYQADWARARRRKLASS